MIKLAFIAPQRKIIKFEVDGLKVKYFDDIWKDGLLIMPLEEPSVKLQVKKMVSSRKKSVSAVGLLIVDANQGKNQEEYNNCKTEEEVAEIIRKDCKLKGLVEVK